MSKEILVIGAGAVGAVYGRHLSLGEGRVTFLVRPKYKEKYENGIAMLLYNQKRKGIQKFTDFSLISTDKEVAAKSWSQVYITISSTALRTDAFKKTLAAVQKDAILVLLQAGLADFDYISQYYPPEKIVEGMISLVSYQAPLEGENLDPCIAYWFPPMSPSLFSGPAALVDEVLPLFKAGNMPVSRAESIRINAGFATSYFTPFLAALEASDWNFAKLKSSGLLSEVDEAASQAMAITEKKLGTRRPVSLSLLKSPVIRLALTFHKFVVPFDLEVYFKYHFLKVKDQTLAYLMGYLDMGKEYGLETSAIRKLYEKIT